MNYFFQNHKNLLLVLFIVVVAFLIGSQLDLDFHGKEINNKSLAEATKNDFILADYYFNHGQYADGTYDLRKARHYYEKGLLTQSKGDSIAWYQLGRTYFLEGEFDEAIENFNKQLELFGAETLPSVYYMLGLTYGYKARDSKLPEDWTLAELYFQTYLKHDPESPWGATDMAWLYFAQGKYEEMISGLETALVFSPDNPWLLNMYGLALMNTGENELAHKKFLSASSEADKLTAEEWGRSYPGNDPDSWSIGLESFRGAISHNLEQTEL